MLSLLVFIGAVVATVMGISIGANDTCMSMVVGSKALSLSTAVMVGSIFEFIGAVSLGGQVSGTISKGILDPGLFAGQEILFAAAMVSVSLGSAIWLLIATIRTLPVSTTHSIVGSLVGVGLLSGGPAAIDWSMLLRTVMSWFTSPLMGGIIAYVLYSIVLRTVCGKDSGLENALEKIPYFTAFTISILVVFLLQDLPPSVRPALSQAEVIVCTLLSGMAATVMSQYWLVPMLRVYKNKASVDADIDHLPGTQQEVEVENSFVFLVILTGCFVSFAHATNDVSNAIGTFALVVEVANGNGIDGGGDVPFWILLIGAIGMVAGLLFFNRVYNTVGRGITRLTQTKGYAAQMATTISVLMATHLGVPVSSTHVMIGAVTGVALVQGSGSINFDTIKKILMSWVVTIPAAAIITLVVFQIFRSAIGDVEPGDSSVRVDPSSDLLDDSFEILNNGPVTVQDFAGFDSLREDDSGPYSDTLQLSNPLSHPEDVTDSFQLDSI